MFYVCRLNCDICICNDDVRQSTGSSKLMWRSGRSRFHSFSWESSYSSPFVAFCSTPFDSFDKSLHRCHLRYLDFADFDRISVSEFTSCCLIPPLGYCGNSLGGDGHVLYFTSEWAHCLNSITSTQFHECYVIFVGSFNPWSLTDCTRCCYCTRTCHQLTGSIYLRFELSLLLFLNLKQTFHI